MLKVIGSVVMAGFVVAVLRSFGWDPIEAAQWMMTFTWDLIGRVADVFEGNEKFREVTKK